jgi:hypothetical protein
MRIRRRENLWSDLVKSIANFTFIRESVVPEALKERQEKEICEYERVRASRPALVKWIANFTFILEY